MTTAPTIAFAVCIVLVVVLPAHVAAESASSANAGILELPECDRVRNRKARDILTEFIYNVAYDAGYKFPASCSIAPDNDIYASLDKNRIRVRRDKYRCGFCSKIFKQETEIDQHIYEEHSVEIPKTGKCLATYCDIFRCEPPPPKSLCNPAVISKKKYLCQAIMDQCFPPDQSTVAAELHGRMNAEFCDVLTCEDLPEDSLSGKKPKVSVWYVLWWMGLITVLLSLIAYYIAIYCQQQEGGLSSDLKRLSRTRSRRTNTSWNWFKPKIKGY